MKTKIKEDKESSETEGDRKSMKIKVTRTFSHL